MSPLALRGLLLPACFAFLASALSGQEDEPQEPDLPASGERGTADYENPPHALEFTLSGDGLWFGYRSGLHRGRGYTSVGFFAGKDDDFVLQGLLMRYGEPRADVPFGLGIGLGLFGAEIDETSDEVFAITLSGGADYALDRLFGLTYPTRIGVEVTWAPDLATFVDGERVLDLIGRVEADLSTWATAFLGYRYLEVDLADEEDVELDRAFQLGVRLGF
jgi:hypothetical protein